MIDIYLFISSHTRLLVLYEQFEATKVVH